MGGKIGEAKENGRRLLVSSRLGAALDGITHPWVFRKHSDGQHGAGALSETFQARIVFPKVLTKHPVYTLRAKRKKRRDDFITLRIVPRGNSQAVGRGSERRELRNDSRGESRESLTQTGEMQRGCRSARDSRTFRKA